MVTTTGITESGTRPSPAEPDTSEPGATERLWRLHHDEIRSYLRRLVGDTDVAEDLLQLVFLKAHVGLRSRAPIERPRAWLYQVARNSVIDHFRTRRASEPLPDDLSETRAAEAEDAEEAGTGLDRCVRPMIEQLPVGYRDAVLLADIQGLPLAEVAARLRLSLSGAKSRVQRGRAMLERCFHECCELELDGRGRPVRWSARVECGSTVECGAIESRCRAT
jgi:RNA polymerase sigma-70 factor (ECF subfamily)